MSIFPIFLTAAASQLYQQYATTLAQTVAAVVRGPNETVAPIQTRLAAVAASVSRSAVDDVTWFVCFVHVLSLDPFVLHGSNGQDAPHGGGGG